MADSATIQAFPGEAAQAIAASAGGVDVGGNVAGAVVVRLPRSPRSRYVKASEVEITQRVTEARDYILSGKTEAFIKETMSAKYDLSTRTISTYISRARAENVAASGRSKEDWRIEQMVFYRTLRDDTTKRGIDRIRAAERIDKIFGLEQHDWGVRKVEVTGAGGAPIQSVQAVVSVDLTAKMQEYMEVVKAAAMANIADSFKGRGEGGVKAAIEQAAQVLVGGVAVPVAVDQVTSDEAE